MFPLRALMAMALAVVLFTEGAISFAVQAGEPSAEYRAGLQQVVERRKQRRTALLAFQQGVMFARPPIAADDGGDIGVGDALAVDLAIGGGLGLPDTASPMSGADSEDFAATDRSAPDPDQSTQSVGAATAQSTPATTKSSGAAAQTAKPTAALDSVKKFNASMGGMSAALGMARMPTAQRRVTAARKNLQNGQTRSTEMDARRGHAGSSMSLAQARHATQVFQIRQAHAMMNVAFASWSARMMSSVGAAHGSIGGMHGGLAIGGGAHFGGHHR
jgi:hypothetical protein